MSELALSKPRILPPTGLLIALAAQLPILIFRFPLRPSALEMIGGALCFAAGVILNVWAERLFRRNDVIRTGISRIRQTHPAMGSR